MKDLSGTDKPLYLYDGNPISVEQAFIYEITTEKFWKGGYSLIGSTLYKSDRLLSVKKSSLSKKISGGRLEKNLTLIGAPYGFIVENNLPIYSRTLNIKSKKKRK